MTGSKVAKDIGKVFDRVIREYPAAARLQHYVKAAKKRKRKETDLNALQQIQFLLAESKVAQGAIKSGDFDLFAQAFERVIRYTVALHLPAFEAAAQAAGVSRFQSERAKKARRPRLPKRAVMCAINEGCKTAREVQNFLFNNKELIDDWGEIDVESRADKFIITDINRNTKKGTLPARRINTVVSEIRRSPLTG